MTAQAIAVINELNDKIERIIKLYISSLEKNKYLDNEISKLRIQIEQIKNENKELQQNMKNLRIANAFANNEGCSEAKTKISKLMREIDSCVALLND